MTADFARIAAASQGGDTVAAWLLNEAGNLADTKTVVGGLAQRLVATGFPLYLGRDAGRRVLGGLIRRGEGITIAAALWYCDLRNFTATTEALSRTETIALLNDYFECMVAPVHRQGARS
jgi:class 3 adenylate cyclase